MFKFNSYCHSVMINFFEFVLIACFAIMCAYQIDMTFGNIVHLMGSLVMMLEMFKAFPKIMNPRNWELNCWHKGGK